MSNEYRVEFRLYSVLVTHHSLLNGLRNLEIAIDCIILQSVAREISGRITHAMVCGVM